MFFFFLLANLPTFIALLVWFALAYGVIYLLRKTLTVSPNAKRIIIRVTLVAFIWLPFWRLFPGLPLATLACRLQAGTHMTAPVHAEGFYRENNTRSYGNTTRYSSADILEDLVVKKFKFVEEEMRATEYIDDLRQDAIGNGTKVRRFYVEAKTSLPEGCKGYRNGYEFRKIGFSGDLCVVTENSDTILSKYAFSYDKYSSGFPAFIPWERLKITDRSSGKSVAEFKYFYYRAFGNNLVGGYVGVGYHCENRNEHRTFLAKAILPAETAEFLASRNLDSDSPVYRFYTAKHTLHEIELPSDVNQSMEGRLEWTESRRVGYRYPALKNTRGTGDGNVSLENGFLYITKNDETRKIPTPNGANPSYIFANTKLVHVENDNVYIVSLLDDSRARGAIAKYSTAGRLISVVNFDLPDIEWHKIAVVLPDSFHEGDGVYHMTVGDYSYYGGERVLAEYDFKVWMPSD